MRRIARLAALLLSCLCIPALAAEPGDLLTILLPHDVTIQAPRDWEIQAGAHMWNEEANRTGLLDLRWVEFLPQEAVRPYAASLHDDQDRKIATVLVRYEPDMPLDQQAVADLTPEALQALDAVLRKNAQRSALVTATDILAWNGLAVEDRDGRKFLRTEYDRTPFFTEKPDAPFHVVQLRHLEAERSVMVVVSWRVDEAARLQPLCEGILRSLAIRRETP